MAGKRIRADLIMVMVCCSTELGLETVGIARQPIAIGPCSVHYKINNTGQVSVHTQSQTEVTSEFALEGYLIFRFYIHTVFASDQP
jgi:hypothetical protein